jgi:pyruvate formate lyase activating enzyme
LSQRDLGRRRFLELLAGGCGAACLGSACAPTPVLAQDAAGAVPLLPPDEPGVHFHPARWWKKKEGLKVECNLCPRHCIVADIERGTCGVRENRGGEYYTLVHSRPCSLNLDPIEKKPFFHVLPGTPSLSLATAGCNFDCRFCQNWEIAQARPEQIGSISLTPAEAVALARVKKAPTIACTYTEPVVFSEYMYDIAETGRKAGVRTLMVSNGYIDPEPANDLSKVLGAVKIDLKAYTERFYKETCSGELKPVLDTLRLLRKNGMWVEIVDLIVPTLNDGAEEIRELAKFVKNDLGPEVPIHFTRFHPSYRLRNLPATPMPTLERAYDVARKEGLQFVYLGNVRGHPAESTYCPGCGKLLIRRVGYAILENRMKDGRCPDCGRAVPGVWS